MITGTPEKQGQQPVGRHGYLFGLKIANSYSPLIHRTIYRDLGLSWDQRLWDSTDILNFLLLLRDPACFGASITMPNKITIVPYLDELTPECRDVGACNTIFFQYKPDGTRLLCGTNTDTIGVRDSFYQNVSDPDAMFHNKPAIVIGGGGAARSAVYALRKWMKVTDIYLVNRDKTEVHDVIDHCMVHGFGQGLVHIRTIAEAKAASDVGSIVACIPDISPRTDEETEARSVIEVFLQKESKGIMLEMCYNPRPHTELSEIASREGWQVILGTEAVLWQGIEQNRHWIGDNWKAKDSTVELVRDAVAAKLGEVPKKE
ncbi:hypothetical protein MRS44_012051 [Fusarium solani]|uniref:uncharacterized protein n=1 Tax=Fusarium solani TaxID=169388 RepID=UPI0032C3ED1A|nr:hypothetical protein MRS44_012051 [Fusarium solani]